MGLHDSPDVCPAPSAPPRHALCIRRTRELYYAFVALLIMLLKLHLEMLYICRCFYDVMSYRGLLFGEILTIIQMCCFITVTISYGAIWLKIQRIARLMSSDDSRYTSSARVMMVFIAVFIFQVISDLTGQSVKIVDYSPLTSVFPFTVTVCSLR